MQSIAVLQTENNFATGAQHKIQKATKAPSGNTSRKMLADISNLPQQNKTLIQDGNSQVVPITTKEYVDQLQKENMALMKIVAERNKLIEVTGIELQKLKVNMQKMQIQNLQLAQSNSQMLMDLNSGKDRLKALQHELGCLNGVLKAKNVEVQKLKLQVRKREIVDDEVKQSNSDAAEESKLCSNEDKLGNANRRPQSKSCSLLAQSKDINENKRTCTRRKSARFEREELKPDERLFDTEDVTVSVCQPTHDSLEENVSTSTFNDVHGNEVETKRPCARRQSARFKCAKPKPSDDISEMKDAEISSCLLRDDKMEEEGLNSTSSFKNEEKEGISAPVFDAQGSRRSSMNRPLRQAAKKVQTYKEIPVNIKMRRSE
ncbi:SHUGOSHIN 1 [Coffea eugenioides]|uniref:SHUGOSHIN 1 n=1 Tax=Coffea eugenioides TaxID=49369 RepID=UPI000F60B246|nr:SHUGOSHIN 1 [Coffea eugenioides]